jgi:hypothetical protein
MKLKLWIFITVIALQASAAWACRPNVHAIQHDLMMEAIEAVHAQTGHSVLNLSQSKMVDFQMRFVNTNGGYQCPDRYDAKIELTYSDRLRNPAVYMVDVAMGIGATAPVVLKVE